MRSPKQRRKMIHMTKYEQRALSITRKNAEKGHQPLPTGYSFIPGRSEAYVLAPVKRAGK